MVATLMANYLPPIPRPRPLALSARPVQSQTTGAYNPFGSFVGDALQDLGYGLTTANGWNALGAATQRSAELAPMREERDKQARDRNATIEAFREAGRTDLLEYVQNGGDMNAAYGIFLKDAAEAQKTAQDQATRQRSSAMFTDPNVKQAYIDGEIDFNAAVKLQAGGGSDTSYFGTPIPFTRSDGSIGYMQLNNAGGNKEVQFPDGSTPAIPVEYLNTKTGFEGRDKYGNPAGGSLDINNQQAAFDTELGGGQAKNLLDGREAAVNAQQAIRAGEDALRLLDQGMITGAFADWKVGFGKALQAAGFNFAQDEIANTEAFVATRATEVGRLITMFGAGTGLSDADRQYAEKAAAGQITLTEESIRKIIELNAKAARNILNNYNAQAGMAQNGQIPPLTVGGSGPAPSASDPLGLGF